MSQGTIVQCIGAVVDVEFPRDQIPEIYDALKLDEIGLTLEVQQQRGDGVVRTIALGSSDSSGTCGLSIVRSHSLTPRGASRAASHGSHSDSWRVVGDRCTRDVAATSS